MFELLLNTAKFVFSKDAREGTNALFEALTASPDWQKDICTLEARVPATEEERFFLLADIVAEKMRSISYSGEACAAFRTCSQELISNAIEHGCAGSPTKRVSVTVEISPTYVSLAVKNPRGSTLSLEEWLRDGKVALENDRRMDRGRGLQVVAAHADILQQVGRSTIKSIIYRDRVEIFEESIGGETVLAVVGGIANPSLPHRIISRIRKLEARNFVICLDPKESLVLRTNPEAIRSVKTLEPPKDETPQQRDDDYGMFPTTKVAFLLRDDLSDSDSVFRFVLRDKHFVELLPDGFAFQTIKDAIDSLRRGGDSQAIDMVPTDRGAPPAGPQGG